MLFIFILILIFSPIVLMIDHCVIHFRFKNHENSKKHKENVALLKSLMEEEEAMAQNVGDNISEDVPPDSDQEESTSKDLLDELIKR